MGEGREAAAAAFFAFLEGVLEEAGAELSLFKSSGGTSGAVASTYVSRRDESATAEVTQTTGVSVSMSRTMTPAK